MVNRVQRLWIIMKKLAIENYRNTFRLITNLIFYYKNWILLQNYIFYSRKLLVFSQLNIWTPTAIFKKIASTYDKLVNYTKLLTATPRFKIRISRSKLENYRRYYKTVRYKDEVQNQFSTKRLRTKINSKNVMHKIPICLFSIATTLTWQAEQHKYFKNSNIIRNS